MKRRNHPVLFLLILVALWTGFVSIVMICLGSDRDLWGTVFAVAFPVCWILLFAHQRFTSVGRTEATHRPTIDNAEDDPFARVRASIDAGWKARRKQARGDVSLVEAAARGDLSLNRTEGRLSTPSESTSRGRR